MKDAPTLPQVDIAPRGEEARWFEYCNERRLTYQVCRDCRAVIFYPRGVCPECLSSALEWIDSAGRGSVFTFTIQRRPALGFEHEVPYALAIIELDEGFRMMARVLGDHDAISVGAKVEVDFARAGSQLIPVFRLTGSEPS